MRVLNLGDQAGHMKAGQRRRRRVRPRAGTHQQEAAQALLVAAAVIAEEHAEVPRGGTQGLCQHAEHFILQLRSDSRRNADAACAVLCRCTLALALLPGLSSWLQEIFICTAVAPMGRIGQSREELSGTVVGRHFFVVVFVWCGVLLAFLGVVRPLLRPPRNTRTSREAASGRRGAYRDVSFRGRATPSTPAPDTRAQRAHSAVFVNLWLGVPSALVGVGIA